MTTMISRLWGIYLLIATGIHAGEPVADLRLQDFRPQSLLKVPENPRPRARFPVVDIHMHFRIRQYDTAERLQEYVRVMDQHHVIAAVSLDGTLGDIFLEHRDFLWKEHRSRFLIFANIDWRGTGEVEKPETWDCQRPDFAPRIARQLGVAQQAGASGLKIFKSLGLEYRNPDGSLIMLDDPRWKPIWDACGQLGLPVLIHTADPAAFFLPVDATNERYEELQRRPEWSFYGPNHPPRDQLLQAFLRTVSQHPNTTFIGAHVAGNAEDLGTVGQWLDQHPNLYVEIASRISELGRQPYTARDFFIKYADRILFGTDGPWPAERLALYWRFLETRDEYFPYSERPFPPQGFWRIYGLNLPDDVLRKVYHENAARIIPGVRERLANRAEREVQ